VRFTINSVLGIVREDNDTLFRGLCVRLTIYCVSEAAREGNDILRFGGCA
jgi:hypothetical protein